MAEELQYFCPRCGPCGAGGRVVVQSGREQTGRQVGDQVAKTVAGVGILEHDVPVAVAMPPERMSRVPWNFGGGPLIVRPR